MTGAEELLKLKAIDLSKDLPVEILHTLLLGMTKYCFKIAHDHFLKEHQLKELTKLFRNYNSKALHRNLTSSLTNYRSYLGRDFKILVQLLPSILQKANFLDPLLFAEKPTSFVSMYQCFNHLSLLASLVYMEKIDSFHYYKEVLDKTVSDTISSMDNLHHTTVSARRRPAAGEVSAISKMNFSSLCNRLKSHLLVHLSQDADHFAGGPHTEIERGEQQHKFMRELLCHTNRQNGGRDVAIRFAEECMLRHISQGGLFAKDPSSSVLGSFDPTLYQSELELLDNNNSRKKLVVGLTGVFHNSNSSKSSGLTLGKVVLKTNDERFLVEAYDLVANGANPEDPQACIYDRCVVDAAKNAVTRRLPNDDFMIAGHEQNRIELVLDMSQSPLLHAPPNEASLLLSINKSKFGGIWWLLNTNWNLEKIIRLSSIP